MKGKKIVVVGSINTDIVIGTDQFPRPGETVIGNSFMSNRGGKGANQAVAASRLGGDVTMVGRVGHDSLGKESVKGLHDENIDIFHVFETEGISSGVAVITTAASGENTIIVDPGANGCVSRNDILRSEECFHGAGIVLMQLETPVEALIEAAALGKKYGAMVILNPAPAPIAPLPKELIENTDLVIPNEVEASALSGISVTDSQSAYAAISAILRMGFKDVIITLGAMGAAAIIDGKPAIVPSFKVKAVDTTAAGDTFCSALSVALLEGMPKDEAILFANRASSLTVQRKGAQMSMPSRLDVDSIRTDNHTDSIIK